MHLGWLSAVLLLPLTASASPAASLEPRAPIPILTGALEWKINEGSFVHRIKIAPIDFNWPWGLCKKIHKEIYPNAHDESLYIGHQWKCEGIRVGDNEWAQMRLKFSYHGSKKSDINKFLCHFFPAVKNETRGVEDNYYGYVPLRLGSRISNCDGLE